MAFPPGPRTSSLEQLRRFMSEPETFFSSLAAEYGPVFSVHLFGQNPWVIVSDPDLVRQIFTLGTDEMVNAAEGVKFMLGPRSVLFLDGEAHRRERRLLLPHFHHGRMRAYADEMRESADAALAGLSPGTTMPAVDLMVRITLRTIVECVFGVTDVARRERLIRLFAINMHMTQQPAFFALSLAIGGDRVRSLIERGVALSRARYREDDPAPSRFAPRRFFDVKAEIADILRLELERCRTEDSSGREDMLALLARSRYEDGTPVEDAALVDHLMTLLIGGHETTSITMAWALYFLATEPAARAKVVAELEAAFGEGPVVPERIDDLPYLAAFLDETMRIRPIAQNLPRRVARETTLGPWTLPAGTDVFPSVVLLHFREDLWPNPHVFSPERFLGKRGDPFRFFPFGGGARTCVGRSFALTQMKLVLAELVQRLDFHLAPGADPKMTFQGILMGPSDGVPIVIDAVRPARVRPVRAHAAE